MLPAQLVACGPADKHGASKSLVADVSAQCEELPQATVGEASGWNASLIVGLDGVAMDERRRQRSAVTEL